MPCRDQAPAARVAAPIMSVACHFFEKRKELDARRSKCRIRIGSHLEQWCRLKEQLGFSLHSQLAKYLLDRYSSQSCAPNAGKYPRPVPTGALQHLVILSHNHSQECSFIPCMKSQSPCHKGAPSYLTWECLAGHTFLWGAHVTQEEQTRVPLPHDAASRRKEERAGSSKPSPPPSPKEKATASSPDGVGEKRSRPPPQPDNLGTAGGPEGTRLHQQQESQSPPGHKAGQPQQPFLPLHSHPSPSFSRKAAKREILLCDFDGCGKIFSNRQYLNHHKKYQHVHQKTFTCSEPSCGKSFNFKKHLKEHEKLHSDKRDYICEFCARSFRTSSNLIIHRRIHTGEKPLQCEICGFTCRQKASLNWHMKKHDADSFYQFSCDLCGKKFEKKDNVTAHKSKSHPELRQVLQLQEAPQGSHGTRPSHALQSQPTAPLPVSYTHLDVYKRQV
uniref:Zinc finger protein 692 n=1 Tax=Sphenodon punctatus TaxID=8508 RepID=A0A8D0L1E2_SPHPU